MSLAQGCPVNIVLWVSTTSWYKWHWKWCRDIFLSFFLPFSIIWQFSLWIESLCSRPSALYVFSLVSLCQLPQRLAPSPSSGRLCCPRHPPSSPGWPRHPAVAESGMGCRTDIRKCLVKPWEIKIKQNKQQQKRRNSKSLWLLLTWKIYSSCPTCPSPSRREGHGYYTLLKSLLLAMHTNHN